MYESVSQPISTYHELKWSYRGDDEFYCLDIFDKDWRLLHQAVACGEGVHQFSPRNLNLAPGEYHWKVWSPSVANYHEAQPGLEGDFTAGECGLPYRSDKYWVQWGCRNQDLLYCIDIYAEDGQPVAKPYHCAEYLHQFSPRVLDNLGVSEAGKYRWKVWSPSVTNYDDPQLGFEGEFYFEPPKPITPAMNVSWEVLRAHDISASYIDDAGILWLGTTGGLEKWQLEPTKQLLASWHRTSGGFPANQINAIAPGTSNSLWLATDQGLINFRDGAVLNHFTSDNSSLSTKHINTVAADGKGGIWVGLIISPYLMHFDGFNQWQSVVIPTTILDKFDKFYFNKLKALANDQQGGVWVGLRVMCVTRYCSLGGILHYDGQGNWYILNETHTDTTKDAKFLITDEQGKLWTTIGSQLTYFDGQRWEKGPSIPFIDQAVNQGLTIKSLANSQQGLWIGVGHHLYPQSASQVRNMLRYDQQNQWRIFELENKWRYPSSFSSIAGLGDRLWIKSWSNDLSYFDGKAWQRVVHHNVHPILSQLEIDPSTGRLWAISNNPALIRQTGKGDDWQELPSLYKNTPYNNVENFLPANDGGGFWVRTGQMTYIDGHGHWQVIPTPDNLSAYVLQFTNDKQGGLWMAMGRKLSYFHFNESVQEYSLDHLRWSKGDSINYLFHDGQKLWVSTWHTLTSFDGQNWQTFNLQSILEDKGYQFNSHGYSTEVGEVKGVEAIASDNAGGIWLGINSLYGLLHFDGQATWTYFNDNQKLPMGDRSQITQLYDDGYGQLWAASSNNSLIRMRFE